MAEGTKWGVIAPQGGAGAVALALSATGRGGGRGHGNVGVSFSADSFPRAGYLSVIFINISTANELQLGLLLSWPSACFSLH